MVPVTMTTRSDVDFILAGGATHGLGHVMRCAALASAARRRGWASRAYLDGDRTAGDRWRIATGQRRPEAWSDWSAEDAACVTFVDHPGDKGRWLSRLSQSGTRIVVLDDARFRSLADLTICPALHHLPTDISHEKTDSRMLFGPRFAILAEIHLVTPSRPHSTRNKLLLSLGGADPHQLTPRVAPILASVLNDSEVLHGIRTRHVVLGPAFADPDRLARKFEDSDWQIHRALDGLAMARLMAESKLAVMGFGTSLSELAWHGTPFLSITHHASDDPLARSLERQGIGVHLGSASSLNLEVVASRFRRALEDDAWQRTSAEAAQRALEDGLGVERILDRIERSIHQRPTPQPSTRSTKGHHVAPL